MAELDVIKVSNPLGEEFSCRFNGELYKVPAESEAFFPHFLAFHMAKHLSDKMLSKEVEKTKKAKTDNPFNPKVAQVEIYDNPDRRIALYDILGTKELVEKCINAFPFKGFLGEMSDYDKYVEKKEKAKDMKVDE
jgi:hypothetical protein